MDRPYKRKNYYHQKSRGGGSNNWSYNKKKTRNYLDVGMRGFLCTCNFREKDCVRESYNILNEYAEKLNLQDKSIIPPKEEVEHQPEVEEEGDIEDELRREVDSLKTSSSSRTTLFCSVDTGVPNLVFIKTTLEDPVMLAHTIMSEAEVTKTQKCRFLMRLVPVEVICKANLDDIKAAADAFFDKHFRCEATTFCIVFNKRYNDKLLRDEVIHALALLVTDKNSEHKANLKEAKKTIILEIMKSLCCMTVLEDYVKFKKYNLSELTKPEAPEVKNETETEKEKDVDNCDETEGTTVVVKIESDENDGDKMEEKDKNPVEKDTEANQGHGDGMKVGNGKTDIKEETPT